MSRERFQPILIRLPQSPFKLAAIEFCGETSEDDQQSMHCHSFQGIHEAIIAPDSQSNSLRLGASVDERWPEGGLLRPCIHPDQCYAISETSNIDRSF
jgi:hypothetical protein